MRGEIADSRGRDARNVDFAGLLGGCLDWRRDPVPEDGRWTAPRRSPLSVETEVMVLLYGLVVALKPPLVVETGCHQGYTTRCLAAAARTYGGFVVGCDVDEAALRAAEARCAGMPARLKRCPGLDLEELAECDFALIDSSVESRVLEIGRLKAGCLGAMHDAGNLPDLRRAVEKEARRWVMIPCARGVALFEKR